MKQDQREHFDWLFASRPVRGAWVETTRTATGFMSVAGRAPHGARGLKLRSSRRAMLEAPAPISLSTAMRF